MQIKVTRIVFAALLIVVIAAITVYAHTGYKPVDLNALSASAADCGPRALLIICDHLGVSAHLDTLRRYAGTTGQGTSMFGLQKAAEAYGLHATGVQATGAAIEQISGPAIAWVDRNHYIAVLSVQGEKVRIHDPNQPKEELISTDDLLRRSGGYLLLISR
jgi:ABC-type bacteriocin/lantibiotic exporter with double-glycine peptidase domain